MAATAAALGVLTPQPCTMVPAGILFAEAANEGKWGNRIQIAFNTVTFVKAFENEVMDDAIVPATERAGIVPATERAGSVDFPLIFMVKYTRLLFV